MSTHDIKVVVTSASNILNHKNGTGEKRVHHFSLSHMSSSKHQVATHDVIGLSVLSGAFKRKKNEKN